MAIKCLQHKKHQITLKLSVLSCGRIQTEIQHRKVFIVRTIYPQRITLVTSQFNSSCSGGGGGGAGGRIFQ